MEDSLPTISEPLATPLILMFVAFLIAFRSNTGLESYWTYHEQAIDGGSGYINDYSGNLIFDIPITGTLGATLPVQLDFVYNSCLSDQQYQNNKKGSINRFCLR